jgi:hypothetical protein
VTVFLIFWLLISELHLGEEWITALLERTEKSVAVCEVIEISLDK